MFKLLLRIYLISAMILCIVLEAYDINDYVFKHADPTRIYLIDDTYFVAYDFSNDSYRAFDIRDSGFPEVANPKNIYHDLKYRYLKQEPLAIERNSKEIE